MRVLFVNVCICNARAHIQINKQQNQTVNCVKRYIQSQENNKLNVNIKEKQKIMFKTFFYIQRVIRNTIFTDRILIYVE